jgi:hypothetical protein
MMKSGHVPSLDNIIPIGEIMVIKFPRGDYIFFGARMGFGFGEVAGIFYYA